ncbi:MAG TPA: CopD family protein, partial [Longimicrobiales bacterium]|nr:CopD family protein [Longimicrobiales bacterium]
AVAALVNAFSPIALVFAGLVVLTGALSAWLHLGTPSALWTSGYGRVLLAKLGAVGLVAAAGAYNWRRARPRLGDVPAARRLTRSATLELAIGALVLVITAVLVATPPPGDAFTP